MTTQATITDDMLDRSDAAVRSAGVGQLYIYSPIGGWVRANARNVAFVSRQPTGKIPPYFAALKTSGAEVSK